MANTILPGSLGKHTLEPQGLASVFNDSLDEPIVSYQLFDMDRVRIEIQRSGYSVVRGLISTKWVDPIREFWIRRFGEQAEQGRVTWSPHMGQHNHFGFSNDKFQHLYRACDFLWNEPIHTKTRELCLRLNALRNLLIGEDPLFGLRFTDQRYGIFVTASYYPADTGRMDIHDDGVSGQRRLWHCLAPMTFKGPDYRDGGMVVFDRTGKRVDVDSQLNPGDAVFYDGTLRHGVDRIIPNKGARVGRLQVFPIPTHFKNLEESPMSLSRVKMSQIMKARWYRLKSEMLIKLGISSSVR